MAAPRNNASHDQNNVPTLIGVSTSDGTTPVPAEVNPLTGAVSVTTVGPDGTSTLAYATRTDSATTANVMYVGKAAIASTTASATWQVFKMDETTIDTLIITWADGNANFDNIWNNRASLSYS